MELLQICYPEDVCLLLANMIRIRKVEAAVLGCIEGCCGEWRPLTAKT